MPSPSEIKLQRYTSNFRFHCSDGESETIYRWVMAVRSRQTPGSCALFQLAACLTARACSILTTLAAMISERATKAAAPPHQGW